MKLTEFRLNESLFTEVLGNKDFDELFQGTDVHKANPQTLDMIKNPYKQWGTDPYTGKRARHILQKEAFILLRLYELTIVNPNNPYTKQGKEYVDKFTGEVFPGYGVKKSDLLRMMGAANPDTVGEGGTYWGDFGHIGLAYSNPGGDLDGYLCPGSRLTPYITGTLDTSWGAQALNRQTKKMEPFTNDTSMEGDVGRLADRPRSTPSASKTRNPANAPENPFANIPGIKVRPQPQKKDPTEDDPYAGFGPKQPVEEPQVEEQPVAKTPEVEDPVTTTETPIEKPVATKPVAPAPTFRKFDTSRFKKKAVGESLDEDFELVDDAYLLKDYADLIEKVKAAYRSWRGLADDADITDEYNTYDFKALCCCNKWPVDIRLQIWPGRDFE